MPKLFAFSTGMLQIIQRGKPHLCFVILLLITISGYPQSIKHKFERITVKDGLANSNVYYILQDKTGFMWFATYDGVSKYDGYSFTNYRHEPDNPNGLSNNTIEFLMEDNKGYIWIVNDGNAGIDRYDPILDQFVNFRHNPDDPNSISSNTIFHLIQDKKGQIWLSGDNALNRYIEENGKIRFESFPYPEGTSNFQKIIENKDGILFLFSENIYYFDREKNKFIATETSIEMHDFNSIVEDKDGSVFLGTINRGIKKFTYNTVKKKYTEVKDFNLNVAPMKRSCMTIDSKGQIWIGTETQGLYMYLPEDKRISHFENNEQDKYSLSDNSVYSLYVDRTGVLWIGTMSQGLCNYDLYHKRFYHYKSSKGDSLSLSGNLISGIHSNSVHEIWVGIQGDGGVNRILFDENGHIRKVRTYQNEPGNDNSLPTSNVNCLVHRKNGDVWVGGGSTRIGIIKAHDPDSKQIPEIERIYTKGWNFSIFEDSYGIVWGGTWGAGMWRFHYDSSTFSYFKNDPKNPKSICDDIIWAIHEDKYNNLWIGGSNNGISILPEKEREKNNPAFINFTYEKNNPGSLSNNSINAFMQDSKGNMWIATAGGLNFVPETELKNIQQYKTLTFKVFKEKDGLPDNGVIGIIEDKNNNLWLSTSNGISFFDLNDSSFTNYFESDGLQSDEFAHNAFFADSDGKVFFGGKNGISAFYPSEIKPNPFVPEIVITDLKIFNKTVKVGEKINHDIVLQKSISKTREITLSHKNNFFTLEFAALHYTQPYKNQLAYYLEGFEDDWNYLENGRSATYTNLNPGKYVFRVKGSNNNGLWSEKERTLIIKVVPPWWKTWIFRILLVILLVSISYLAIQMRIRKIQREKKIMKDRIEEGERELQIRKTEIEKQKHEIEEQNRKEFEIRYLHEGMSKFSEILSSNRMDLYALCTNAITDLVKYTKSDSGIIFLADNTDTENIQLKYSGSYCYSCKDAKNKTILPGEGFVGTCFNEMKTMQIDNLPQGYLELSSGLGASSLRTCILSPIMNDNECLGVIELGSINTIEAYKVEFINKLAENLGSVITISKANEITRKMLEQNRIQSEELISQEEILRQNLEEMAATQEDLKKQIEASEKTKKKLLFEQSLSNAFLEDADEGIYFKDLDSRFIKASKSMKAVFNVNDLEEIYGKSDFDFFTEEHSRPAFEDEQKIIKTGEPIFDKLEKETHADGRIQWVSTTKMPLRDPDGKIIGTFGISRNVTELIVLRQEVEKNEVEITEMQEKIEKLQEELQKNKT